MCLAQAGANGPFLSAFFLFETKLSKLSPQGESRYSMRSRAGVAFQACKVMVVWDVAGALARALVKCQLHVSSRVS